LTIVTQTWAKLTGVPFDACSATDLTNHLKKKGITNFVDPDFPPLYEILYDPAKYSEYPFKNAVHFKRPKEWL